MTRVLVVDDAAFMRARSSKLLGEKGYEVVEAANGAEALEVYKSQRPDCVLLDITMPKMDPTARVAMVTAMGQKTMVMNALKAGARDFVVKPFDGARVVDTVQKLIG